VSDAVVLTRPEDHIALLTLDRPDSLNAMNMPLIGELHVVLDEIALDPSLRVVVITGNGRGFCAGLDLKDLGRIPKPGEHPGMKVGMTVQEFIAGVMIKLHNLPQIVIAAVNGPAFGGGLSLALSSEIRIASTAASFCSAFIRTGLSGTDMGVSYLLPRLIGVSRAFDMILTGRTVDAAEAERLGLVSRVVEPEALVDEAFAVARTIAGYSRGGLLLTKEVLWHSVDAPNLASAIAMENRNQLLASQSGEIVEYQERFRKK